MENREKKRGEKENTWKYKYGKKKIWTKNIYNVIGNPR